MASAARGRRYQSQTAYAWVGAVFGVVLALLAADLVLVLEGRHGPHPPADNGLVQRRLDRAGMLFGVRLLV